MAFTWEILLQTNLNLLFALRGAQTHFTDLCMGALSDWTDLSRVCAAKPLQGEHHKQLKKGQN